MHEAGGQGRRINDRKNISAFLNSSNAMHRLNKVFCTKSDLLGKELKGGYIGGKLTFGVTYQNGKERKRKERKGGKRPKIK